MTCRPNLVSTVNTDHSHSLFVCPKLSPPHLLILRMGLWVWRSLMGACRTRNIHFYVLPPRQHGWQTGTKDRQLFTPRHAVWPWCRLIDWCPDRDQYSMYCIGGQCDDVILGRCWIYWSLLFRNFRKLPHWRSFLTSFQRHLRWKHPLLFCLLACFLHG